MDDDPGVRHDSALGRRERQRERKVVGHQRR
jgi:hypothetical protein